MLGQKGPTGSLSSGWAMGCVHWTQVRAASNSPSLQASSRAAPAASDTPLPSQQTIHPSLHHPTLLGRCAVGQAGLPGLSACNGVCAAVVRSLLEIRTTPMCRPWKHQHAMAISLPVHGVPRPSAELHTR